MKDNEIDYSDIPEIDEKFFAEAVFLKPFKKQLTLRIDADVYDYFKHQGKGYTTLMNAILRKYVDIKLQLAQDK
jgi:uncharacterized protein (DUF4415 family)